MHFLNLLRRGGLLIALPMFVSAGAARADLPVGTWEAIAGAPVAPTFNRIDDVCFVNPRIGWVANLGAQTIHGTLNGGATWPVSFHAQSQLGYAVSWRSLAFVDSLRGYAGNLNSTNNPTANRSLFETVNGGLTWQNISTRITGPAVAGLCGMQVVSSQVIVATGRWNGPAVFARSTDSGQHWTSHSLAPLATGLIDVHFFSADTGLVVGGRGVGTIQMSPDTSRAVILRTTNGGASWTTVYESTHRGIWCWKVDFPTRLVGYVTTEGIIPGGFVLKTVDGGETWSEVPVVPAASFQGVGFLDESRGWIGKEDQGMFGTTAGGAAWDSLAAPPVNVNRIQVVDDTLAYAVGNTVYRFRGPAPTVSVPGHGLAAGPVLDPARPNPFTAGTELSFQLASSGSIELDVLDLTGRVVRRLASGRFAAGQHFATWDGRDQAGAAAPAGVYYVRLRGAGDVVARPVLLLR